MTAVDARKIDRSGVRKSITVACRLIGCDGEGRKGIRWFLWEGVTTLDTTEERVLKRKRLREDRATLGSDPSALIRAGMGALVPDDDNHVPRAKAPCL